MTQQWNSSQNSANTTLSNVNLTATKTAGTGTYGNTFALNGVTTGRWYWEETLTTVSQAQEAAVGIGNINSSTVSGQWLGIGTDTIGWFFGSGGGVWNNNAQVATWAAINSSPLTMCYAMDLISNRLFGRIANGNWDNDILANQNPAVGSQVGGITIPAGVLAAAVVPGCSLGSTVTPDKVIAAFAQSSWAFTAPAGFSPFDSSVVAWPRAAVSFR